MPTGPGKRIEPAEPTRFNQLEVGALHDVGPYKSRFQALEPSRPDAYIPPELQAKEPSRFEGLELHEKLNVIFRAGKTIMDLKKAGPPPIPNKSPWDKQTPPPTPQPLQAPAPDMWAGRFAVMHPDHKTDLDMHAAVEEFGPHRMERAKAEEKAYADYKQKQHVIGASHHLKGLRASHSAGDTASAKKHYAMYSLHSKAIGHDVAKGVHPDVLAQSKEPNQSYMRFKAHRSDMFVLPKLPTGK